MCLQVVTDLSTPLKGARMNDKPLFVCDEMVPYGPPNPPITDEQRTNLLRLAQKYSGEDMVKWLQCEDLQERNQT